MRRRAGGKSGWNILNQLLVQLKGLGATIALASAGTLLICVLVEKTVRFRLDEAQEINGLDQSIHGEHGYDIVG